MKLIDLGNNFASLPCKPIHNKFWHCKLIGKKKRNEIKWKKEWKNERKSVVYELKCSMKVFTYICYICYKIWKTLI